MSHNFFAFLENFEYKPYTNILRLEYTSSQILEALVGSSCKEVLQNAFKIPGKFILSMSSF